MGVKDGEAFKGTSKEPLHEKRGYCEYVGYDIRY
jgi:hypothetical protein